MRYVLLAGAALALGAAAPLGAQDVGLAVGTRAPAVTVQDLDGKSVDLGQYIGHQPVVLEFWATWCPLCKALEPSLKAAHARYGRTVRFVAIGVGVNQSPASIRRHLAAHPLPFPVLFDADGAAVRAYEAPTTSYIVVVDKRGTVTYTGTGAEQDIAAVLKKGVEVGGGR
jgi:peroxiredoxin